MALYMIGIGLDDEKDITVKGLEIVKKSSKVFLESYTSKLNCPIEKLEELYGKKVILANRDLVEKNANQILENASKSDVSFLVIGDPMSATTHTDLILRAKEKNIKVEIINNASVLTAIGIVGLEIYKFGKTTSIVFPQKGWDVRAHYDVIKQNKQAGLHTLCLLDIKTEEPSKEDLLKEENAEKKALEPRFMTVNEAIQNLLEIEAKHSEKVFTKDTLCIGCARLGSSRTTIKAGTAKELLDADFGRPLHCLIVPGNLHFMEEDALKQWNP